MAEFAGRFWRRGCLRDTFNVAAIQGLQASGAAERTAKATEDTAKHTKKLVDKANSGGLTFA